MNDELEVWLDDELVATQQVRVGTLSRSVARGKEAVRFCYASEWLARKRGSFAIDPELPLTPGDFHPRMGCTLHGAFRDSAPDRWGRILMERRESEQARVHGRRPCRLSDWDFLLGVSDAARMGGLRLFDPQASRWVDDSTPGIPASARLRELEAAARAIDAHGAHALPQYAEWLRLLIVPGSSLGGARPKASFLDEDGSLWLAKFPSEDDRHDVGAAEFLAHELALAVGVDVPAAKLARLSRGHHTFCVQRFDRTRSSRRMYASAMTLLQRNDGDFASYLEIAEALQRAGDAQALANDLRQLYRRIAFSIAIGNRDDHLRNHGFLHGKSGWRLAPAFDLNPSPDKREHALAIDASDPRPDLGNLRSTASLYRIGAAEATRIEAEVRAAVGTWTTIAARIGISASDREVLATVLEPDPN